MTKALQFHIIFIAVAWQQRWICECAGIGRQARLRGVCLMAYGFKSRHSHHNLIPKVIVLQWFRDFCFLLDLCFGTIWICLYTLLCVLCYNRLRNKPHCGLRAKWHDWRRKFSENIVSWIKLLAMQAITWIERAKRSGVCDHAIIDLEKHQIIL